MEAVFFMLLFMYHTDTATVDCALPNCDVCSGDNCSECSAGFFNSGYYGCLRCYLGCFHCTSGQDVEYYKCSDSSCGCGQYSTNYFPPSRTPLDCMPQPYTCNECPPGYFLDQTLGSFCYKCSHSNCKCTEADNCPECVAGNYNTSNFCQDSCPDNCINCTGANFCGECISGTYGISCDLDCLYIG